MMNSLHNCCCVDGGLYLRQSSLGESGGAGWESFSSSATWCAIESVVALVHINRDSSEFLVALQLLAASWRMSGSPGPRTWMRCTSFVNP